MIALKRLDQTDDVNVVRLKMINDQFRATIRLLGAKETLIEDLVLPGLPAIGARLTIVDAAGKTQRLDVVSITLGSFPTAAIGEKLVGLVCEVARR